MSAVVSIAVSSSTYLDEPLNILKAGQHGDYRITALGQGHLGWDIWVEVLVHSIVLRLIT